MELNELMVGREADSNGVKARLYVGRVDGEKGGE